MTERLKWLIQSIRNSESDEDPFKQLNELADACESYMAQLAQAQERVKDLETITKIDGQNWANLFDESLDLLAENARLRESINKIIEYTNTQYNDGFLRGQIRQAAQLALAQPEGGA